VTAKDGQTHAVALPQRVCLMMPVCMLES